MTEFNPGDRVRYQHKHSTTDKYNGRTAVVNRRGHWGSFFSVTFEEGVQGLALAEELTLLPEPSLYEKVESLPAGTVFRAGGGVPFLRTPLGVRDLLPQTQSLPDTIIPLGWHNMQYKVNVLYTPEEF